MSKYDKAKKLPEVDYSTVPKEIEEFVEMKPAMVTEEVKLTFDGRQFLCRFPKKIAEIMKISPKDKVLFEVEMPLPKSRQKAKLSISLKRDKDV